MHGQPIIKMCTYCHILAYPDDGLSGRNMLNEQWITQLLCLTAFTVILAKNKE
jgi:hypothetical protein